MTLINLAPPAAEGVVSLLEVKAHCRVDYDDDDDLLRAYLAAAVARLDGRDGILGRALAPQSWQLRLHRFPPGGGRIALPLPPLVSVTSIAYTDPAGDVQTLDPGGYVVEGAGGGLPARLRPAGQRWPDVQPGAGEVVAVSYACGYPVAGESTTVPAPIRVAVLHMVGHLYESREAVVFGGRGSELPLSVRALTAPYRLGLAG